MIKPKKSSLKATYDLAALFALLNVVALVGVVAVMLTNGSLSAEKVREIVRVLRGETAVIPESTAPATAPEAATAPADVAAKPAPKPEEVSLMELEAQRLRTELDQRVALANSIMLKVAGERDAFRKEREAAQKQAESDRARELDQGFQKQLDILTSLSPKTALEHLLALNDLHKAARILMSMDTDQAKKIVESARKGEDLARMKAIVQLMQDVTPLAGADQRTEEDER